MTLIYIRMLPVTYSQYSQLQKCIALRNFAPRVVDSSELYFSQFQNYIMLTFDLLFLAVG